MTMLNFSALSLAWKANIPDRSFISAMGLYSPSAISSRPDSMRATSSMPLSTPKRPVPAVRIWWI